MMPQPTGELPVITHHFDYDWSYTNPREDDLSLTVPDMTMTLDQIIDRYSRGLAVPNVPTVPTGGEDYSFIQKMDVFDKIEAARAAQARADVLRETLNTQKAAIVAEKEKKERDAEIEARANEIANSKLNKDDKKE